MLPSYRRVEGLFPHPLPPLRSVTCMSLPLMCSTSPALPFCNINPDLQPPSPGTGESCLEPRKYVLCEDGVHTTGTSQNPSRERTRYMNGCGLVSEWEVNRAGYGNGGGGLKVAVSEGKSYSTQMIRGRFSLFKSFVGNDKYVFARCMCTRPLVSPRIQSG